MHKSSMLIGVGAGLVAALSATGAAVFLGIDAAAALAAIATLSGMSVSSFWIWHQALQPSGQACALMARILTESEHAASDADQRLTSLLQDQPSLQRVLGDACQRLSVMARLQRQLSGASSDNAIAAAEVSYAVDMLVGQVEQQTAAAAGIAETAAEVTGSVQGVAERAATAATSAAQAYRSSAHGKEVLDSAIQNMSRISEHSLTASGLIDQLDERSGQIQAVTEVIDSIASQTNLLALNAAIEAARAGEQGRGFAVVAEQVRELAARTTEATSEVGRIIGASYEETRQVVAAVQALSEEIETGAEQIRAVGDELGSVADEVAQVEGQISAIASSTDANYGSISCISESIQHISVELGNGEQCLLALRDRAVHFTDAAERETAQMAERCQDGQHGEVLRIASAAAAEIGQAFEAAIASGKMSEGQLFDRDYQSIPGTEPQKFHTRYDQIADQLLTPIQEPILAANKALIYAIGTDENGYVPTHNQCFSQPLTGDPARDLAGNRTKRIFNDPTGSRCGAHTRKLLVQTYKRDTGEVMHDLSVPVYVNGRHWGGFRVGYRPAE